MLPGPGKSFCLTSKPLHCLAVVGQRFGEEFESHKPVEAGVLGLVHHTHPAATKFLDDAVVGDGLTDEGVGVRHSDDILGCDLR